MCRYWFCLVLILIGKVDEAEEFRSQHQSDIEEMEAKWGSFKSLVEDMDHQTRVFEEAQRRILQDPKQIDN